MKLVVKHKSFFDWKLVTADEVKEDDVALPSIHGPNFRHVQIQYEQPNETHIVVPESDLDRMVADHEAGIALARRGYTTKQIGGPDDGKEKTIAPRALPRMSRNELLAEHLRLAVFPFHFPNEAVTEIVIEQHSLEDDDAAGLARYLNRRFVLEDEPPKKAKK